MSDTPRVDAAKRLVALGSTEFDIWNFAQILERELATATRERDEARAEVERLRSAVRWACGYDEGAPHFDPPEDGPRYWWRSELRRRAGLAATATEAKR